MRRQFLILLSAVITVSFVITAILAYVQYASKVEDNAEQMIRPRLMDTMESLLRVEGTVDVLNRVNDASTVDRAYGVAEIVMLKPDIIHQQEELQGICNRLGAEQITITDEHGIVEGAVPRVLVGRNIRDEEDYIPVTTLSEKGEEVVATTDGTTGHGMQFANVRRLDRPGRVRVGFRTVQEQRLSDEASLVNSPIRLRLGQGGTIIVFRRGVCLTHGRTPLTETELLALKPGKVHKLTTGEDKKMYVYAMEKDGNRLVGLLPAKEVYGRGLHTAKVMVVSNLILFLIMFLLVSWLLQRIVVRGISRVNEALMEITEGNFERKVEVRTSPEFVRLSNGINFMVDSLRSVGEERQAHVRRDLELARTIQTTALPNKFPPFPGVEHFDLYAACLQASEVGGDFYDFSMPDENHLHFLVADVDASGIAAALFMMRAMSVIRTLSRSGDSPEKIITEANIELCEGNQTGIHMAIFYGCLDITTGQLEYVNAGQLRNLRQSEGGTYRPLTSRADYVLGDQPDMPYHARSARLLPGDRLLLLTEGVLNATNANNVPFSEKRLIEALQTEAPTVTEVLQLVKTALRQHLEGKRMGKDVTMLALQYNGAPSNETLYEFSAGQTEEAVDGISTQMEEFFAAPSDIARVQEALRSVLQTLRPGTPVRMQVQCTEQLARLQLTFPPPRFNPLEQVTALPVDEADYAFSAKHENTITLCKNLI